MPELAWKGGKCRVPMWMAGCPAGYCGEAALGPQLPQSVLREWRGWTDSPYSNGPCCAMHGGPKAGEPVVFTDGITERGYVMYCAVMPDFENLQESPAGFDGNPMIALRNLAQEVAKGKA